MSAVATPLAPVRLTNRKIIDVDLSSSALQLWELVRDDAAYEFAISEANKYYHFVFR